MNCDIIIPVWDQLELTKNCIKQIIKSTDYPYRLIIIDNGSQKQTQEYLEEVSRDSNLKVALMRNEVNLGYVKAVNQGLAISNAPYVCLLNNDVLVSKGWLSEMVDVADSDKTIGIVNPHNKEINSESIDDLLKYKQNFQGCGRRFIEIMGAVGFCMLIKREVILKVGVLDEAFGVGGYDDMDYSRRAWQAGYKCVTAKRAFVFHRVHSSFSHLGKRRKKQIGKQTRTIFWKKWGSIPRLAFIVSKTLDDQSLLNKVYNHVHSLARDWKMVRLFLKETAVPFQPQHEGIALAVYVNRFFLLRCLKEILKFRKKRLRFKTIFVDDLKFYKLLQALSFIHRAEVILI